MPRANAQKFTQWHWDAARYRAAAQLANGLMTDQQIATEAGVSRRQIIKWKHQPQFAFLVQAITGEAAEAVKDEAVASKAGRLRILVDVHNKLLAIIEARAKQYEQERSWAAGESTGLIVTKETWGKVESREAAVDTATIKELRSLQEQIARELGQWETSIAVKHSGRIDHVHRVNRYESLTDEELEQLEQVAKKLALGEAVG